MSPPAKKRPWFRDPGIGTLPLPCAWPGWIALAAFIVAVAATSVSHSPAMWPIRVGLGGGYILLSFLKCGPRD